MTKKKIYNSTELCYCVIIEIFCIFIYYYEHVYKYNELLKPKFIVLKMCCKIYMIILEKHKLLLLLFFINIYMFFNKIICPRRIILGY